MRFYVLYLAFMLLVLVLIDKSLSENQALKKDKTVLTTGSVATRKKDPNFQFPKHSRAIRSNVTTRSSKSKIRRKRQHDNNAIKISSSSPKRKIRTRRNGRLCIKSTKNGSKSSKCIKQVRKQKLRSVRNRRSHPIDKKLQLKKRIKNNNIRKDSPDSTSNLKKTPKPETEIQNNDNSLVVLTPQISNTSNTTTTIPTKLDSSGKRKQRKPARSRRNKKTFSQSKNGTLKKKRNKNRSKRTLDSEETASDIEDYIFDVDKNTCLKSEVQQTQGEINNAKIFDTLYDCQKYIRRNSKFCWEPDLSHCQYTTKVDSKSCYKTWFECRQNGYVHLLTFFAYDPSSNTCKAKQNERVYNAPTFRTEHECIEKSGIMKYCYNVIKEECFLRSTDRKFIGKCFSGQEKCEKYRKTRLTRYYYNMRTNDCRLVRRSNNVLDEDQYISQHKCNLENRKRYCYIPETQSCKAVAGKSTLTVNNPRCYIIQKHCIAFIYTVVPKYVYKPEKNSCERAWKPIVPETRTLFDSKEECTRVNVKMHICYDIVADDIYDVDYYGSERCQKTTSSIECLEAQLFTSFEECQDTLSNDFYEDPSEEYVENF